MESSIKLHKCLRCGWEWASRLPLPPRNCAQCKRPNWDQPPRQRPQAMPKPRVRMVYPFHDIEVGQSVTVPFKTLPDGQPDLKANGSIGRAIRQEEVRYGKQFYRESVGSKMTITRIK